MWNTIAGIVGVAGGIAGLFALGRQELERRRALHGRREIAEQLARGQSLLAETLLAPRDGELPDLRGAVNKWHSETTAVLKEFRPDAVTRLDNVGHMVFYGDAGERDELANFLRGRLANLGDILARI